MISLLPDDTVIKLKELFDGKIETNTGDTIGKKGKTLDDDTITGGINWYYKNVKIVE